MSSQPDELTVVTWNVNGARARAAEIAALLREQAPDVLCLQEIKCTRPPAAVCDAAQELGYSVVWQPSKVRGGGYAGTALLYVDALLPDAGVVQAFAPTADVVPAAQAEGRVLHLRLASCGGRTLHVLSVYVPNSGVGRPPLQRHAFRLQEWDPALVAYVDALLAEEDGADVLVCGDLNVAVRDADVHNPEALRRKAGFTDEERRSFREGLGARLADAWAQAADEPAAAAADPTAHFTFYGLPFLRPQGKGWRLDYQLYAPGRGLRPAAAAVLRDFGTSDHLPLRIVYRRAG